MIKKTIATAKSKIAAEEKKAAEAAKKAAAAKAANAAKAAAAGKEKAAAKVYATVTAAIKKTPKDIDGNIAKLTDAKGQVAGTKYVKMIDKLIQGEAKKKPKAPKKK